MAKRNIFCSVAAVLALGMCMTGLAGCGSEKGQTVKQAYLDMDKELEFIPKDGTYALPYVANAAGILYNKDLFEENGWKVPTTWQEFTTLCDEIKQSGTLPLYLGFKDTWTCLAPWNALAVGLTDSDTCNQVNMGNTTFSDTYGPVAEKMRALLDYAEKIRMHTVITMPVQHLPAGNLPCIRSEAMRSRRSNQSIRI